MASFTPYTYIQCPCFDTIGKARASDDGASPTPSGLLPDDDDDHAFDPRSPRSNYSLYPIEYLLYCVDCNQIRCPRCVSEELVTIYCPSCLFEVGTSSLKAEGNRCTRSCFQCPICIGPLAVQSLEAAPEPALLSPEGAAPPPTSGPWALCCSYCNWSSTDIGVKFDKPQGIFSQLSKLRHGNGNTDIPVEGMSTKRNTDNESDSSKARFTALKSFYQSQSASANAGPGSLSGSLGDYGYGSPNALSRIMSLYSGTGLSSVKTKGKPTVIREADAPNEGFHLSNLDDSSSISALSQAGYNGTVSRAQASWQPEDGARFVEDLWPIAHLLRSKRAKRCPACRHILSKPEAKVNNTRWRIRLVAGNYIPSITIKPLHIGTPMSVISTAAEKLTPLKPTQYLLTFKNHMFDQIKVNLATPATTPGRFASRVTVLCPQFTIDANSDDYDINEVLKDDHRRRERADTDGTQQVEAGKVWERGRNWVSIVVEVIPASLRLDLVPVLLRKEGEDPSPLQEDEDILEIPMFVRLEWEGEASQDQVGSTTGGKDREKRELAYWCVLGIGRIDQN
ncbi:dynactin Arp1 p62 subunit RO2 [Xylariales sp. PMI_506]|nr:dynactin Arp1 p62 subunit RO2 [Xylariales sp. PMI_506]